MSRISEHHRATCGVEGKCSVPMWSAGSPNGFCDRTAYGQQYAKGTAHAPMHWMTPGHHSPYAPDLCCDHHGGPRADQIRFVRDGNMWCAFMPGFVNLQESIAGFGATQPLAENDLRANERKEALSARQETRHGE